jgi:hypothetical protein
MIFRNDGEVEELLAMTPIIHEWKRRNPDDRIFVETTLPEIYHWNPDVFESEENVAEQGPYYDMNMVRWPMCEFPVEEMYADLIFGERSISDWRPRMYASDDQKKQAEKLVGSGKKASVAFDDKMICAEAAESALLSVEGAGYELVRVAQIRPFNLMFAVISATQLFVGSDGSATAIALATNVPSVVCYSYRSPVFFPPYRRAVPFAALTPSRSLCEHAPVCYSRNGCHEYAKTYSQGCVAGDKFCCQRRNLENDVAAAIRQIGG